MRERSEIIFNLANEAEERGKQPPSFDIRQLSREILLRANNDHSTWTSPQKTRITLTTNHYGRYQAYDLYAQEENDSDVHLYTYGTVSSSLQYKYPLFTHHAIDDPEPVKQDIEKLLLTGPVFDRVADNQTENRIQKIFLTIARSLTIENLIEKDPDYRMNMYYSYLASRSSKVQSEIIDQLYKKVTTISHLHVGPEQFELAMHTDITKFRMQQKALNQGPTEKHL